MAMNLKIAVAIFICVISSGWFFRDWWERNRSVANLIGLLSIVSFIYLAFSIYNQFSKSSETQSIADSTTTAASNLDEGRSPYLGKGPDPDVDPSKAGLAPDSSDVLAYEEDVERRQVAFTTDVLSYKEDVKRRQIALEEAGCDPGPIDGKPGPRTREADRRYRDAVSAARGSDLTDADVEFELLVNRRVNCPIIWKDTLVAGSTIPSNEGFVDLFQRLTDSPNQDPLATTQIFGAADYLHPDPSYLLNHRLQEQNPMIDEFGMLAEPKTVKLDNKWMTREEADKRINAMKNSLSELNEKIPEYFISNENIIRD